MTSQISTGWSAMNDVTRGAATHGRWRRRRLAERIGVKRSRSTRDRLARSGRSRAAPARMHPASEPPAPAAAGGGSAVRTRGCEGARRPRTPRRLLRASVSVVRETRITKISKFTLKLSKEKVAESRITRITNQTRATSENLRLFSFCYGCACACAVREYGCLDQVPASAFDASLWQDSRREDEHREVRTQILLQIPLLSSFTSHTPHTTAVFTPQLHKHHHYPFVFSCFYCLFTVIKQNQA